jgi:hypothetical protein
MDGIGVDGVGFVNMYKLGVMEIALVCNLLEPQNKISIMATTRLPVYSTLL